jgi:flagellar basal body rod protein FlgG
MLSAKLREGVVADNIANSQTVGYQALSSSVSSFGGKLIQLIPGGAGSVLDPSGLKLGTLAAGAMVNSTQLVLTPGPLQQSSNPLAAAIRGAGMFAVQTPAGTLYTRAGNFHVNGTAELVNAQGQPVLGANGLPVRIPPGAGTLRISPDGALVRGGQTVGQVAVFLPPTGGLQPVGQELYSLPAGAAPVAAAPAKLAPGFLEGSNVDVTGQMASLLQIQQVFGADVDALQVANNTMRTAQTQVGAVN